MMAESSGIIVCWVFNFVSEIRSREESYGPCMKKITVLGNPLSQGNPQIIVLLMTGKKVSKLSIIKLIILPQIIWRFSAISLKILTGSFIELDKMISQSFIKAERQ